MRLTHIKLAGFKTFVDPTTIPVPGQRVGVVGPNGCGKSNVIDAVRWVLGESRASALRGESMQDVIFNGAATRKPVSRASVELKFDNSLGKAAGQWSTYAEISVKRVLHRSGESQYFINNLHVRRRDVTDMFLGTGLGPRAYAIIEQGMISRIIEARPEELRVFLEEAAGISKYKERRRETEQRLKDTRENLLRVEDVRQELDKQLQRLEVQAETARRYHELQDAMQIAQHLLWLVRKLEAGQARERARVQVDKLTNELEAEIAALRQFEKQLEAARGAHYAAGDALHAAQGELYGANAEVARLEQQIQHQRETRSRLANQLNAWINQDGQLRGQRAAAEEELARWRGELAVAQLAAEETAEAAARESGGLPQAEAAFRDLQGRHGEVQRQLAQAGQARQIEAAHRSHAHKAVQQLEGRQGRLAQEHAALPPLDGEELEERRARAEDLAAALGASRERQQVLQGALAALEQEQRAAQQAAQRAREQAARTDAALHALRQVQGRLEHQHRIKDWMARHGLDAQPRLWHGIRTEAGWEAALEAVLGERLKAVAVDSLEAARVWLDDVPPAPLAVYAAGEGGAAPADAGPTPLRRFVEGPATVLDEWLAGAYAAASPDEAWSLRERLRPGECAVCREGHVFTRNSVSFHAPQSELHGVLAREREIESLAGELERSRTALEERQAEAQRADAELRGAQEEAAALRKEGNELQQRHHRLQLETERHAQQQQHLGERRGQIEREIADVLVQLEIEREQIGEHEYHIERQQELIDSLQERLEEAAGLAAEAERGLARQRQLVQSAERAAQEAVYRQRNCRAKIEEFERAVGALGAQLDELAGRISELEREAGSLQQDGLTEALQLALAARQEREKELAAARDALAQANDGLQKLEQARLASEQKQYPLRDRLEQARLKEQEARLAEEQWLEQLTAAGADAQVLEPLLERRARAAELQAEAERLAADIEALGAVNLAALEELASGRERKAYLDAQFADLSEAMETLEQAIRRIDRETRSRLQETFDAVNRHFGELFPAVFGGGNARLEMTGEEILDAGVTLTAQPPGKKNSSIHLLSGGEKALTALALVFAMFQLNPAPFCMLDEVDAPLDDSNTERFCELVKKMSQNTQFVYVSHNKITMEMAEQLVGVTMQESGVSRVVAVDLEEAVRLKDAAVAG